MQKFLSMDEYIDIAKRIIRSYVSGKYPALVEKMLRDDDIVGTVANSIMVADWKFDNKIGNRFGYRKMCAQYEIMHIIEDIFKNCPTVNTQEDTGYVNKDIKEYDDKDFVDGLMLQLTNKQKEYMLRHYINGESMRDIASTNNVSVQAISSSINGAIKKLKRAYNIL